MGNLEMKKTILLWVCFLVQLSVFAVTFDVEGVRYEIISQTDQTVSVAIIPKSLSYPSYSTYQGDFNIPESVQFNGITFSVIGIGSNAFSECHNLGSVILPNTIKFIGFGAFAYSSLESLTLPEGLDSIGAAAFRDCALKEITLPKSLRILESTVFCRCYSLTKVKILSNNITSIPDVTFENCSALMEVNIPDAVTSIGSHAFMNTSSLSAIHIPSKVKEMYQYCFYKSGITSINIPNSVTTIGDNAFYGCENLTSISIPDAVTELEGQMFYGCKNLKNVKLPNNLKSLNKQMFRGCTSLESIEIPDGITSIPTICFAECTSLIEVKFPSSLQLIGDNSFKDCTSLRKIQLPEGVKKIENEAFYGCHLSEISFPSTLESVGGWAFGLGEMKELTLPVSLTQIGNYAFDDTQLDFVVCLNPVPCECYENVFKNETYLFATLRVPQESLNLYKSVAPWKNFFNIEGHNISNIDELTDSTNLPVYQYISTIGQISDKPLKGINIIRYKDGSTRKAIIY